MRERAFPYLGEFAVSIVGRADIGIAGFLRADAPRQQTEGGTFANLKADSFKRLHD
jgi:hypothetical protein